MIIITQSNNTFMDFRIELLGDCSIFLKKKIIYKKKKKKKNKIKLNTKL